MICTQYPWLGFHKMYTCITVIVIVKITLIVVIQRI